MTTYWLTVLDFDVQPQIDGAVCVRYIIIEYSQNLVYTCRYAAGGGEKSPKKPKSTVV